MHDSERAGDPLVLKVKVEGLELRGGEHALEDEGSAGKAWEINGFAAGSILAAAPPGARMRDFKVPAQANRGALPVICVPTTAGTGSEATRFADVTPYAFTRPC